MAQYKTGEVAVTNGSQAVNGTGTLWSAEINTGDLFMVEGEGVAYVIGAVNSDTLITLAANYAGATNPSTLYAISRDFTPLYDVPLLSRGDRETAAVYNDAVLKLENAASGGGGGGGLSAVEDDTSPTLGGDLDVASYKLFTNLANNSIILAPNGTGVVRVEGANYQDNVLADNDIPNKRYVDDNAGGGGGLSAVVDDTSPELGGNLDVKDFQIYSTGGVGDIVLAPNLAKVATINRYTDYEDFIVDDGDIPTRKFVLDSILNAYQKRSNLLVNGNFDIWQRSIFQTVDGYGSADQWFFENITIGSRSTQLPPDAENIRHSCSVTPDGTNGRNLFQRIELGGTYLDGNDIVISFWANADSPRDIVTSVNSVSTETHSLTTTWQKFTAVKVGVGPNSHTEIQFQNTGSSTVAYRIAQVQVETGTVATEFISRSIADELALCKRYYQSSYDYGTNPGSITNIGAEIFFLSGLNNSTKTISQKAGFSVDMYEAPFVTLYSPVTGTAGQMYDGDGATDVAAFVDNSTTTGFHWSGSTSGTSTTIDLVVHWTAEAVLT